MIFHAFITRLNICFHGSIIHDQYFEKNFIALYDVLITREMTLSHIVLSKSNTILHLKKKIKIENALNVLNSRYL